MNKFKQIPNIDRPREKLKSKGINSLTDLELIQLVLGSGSKGASLEYLAVEVIKKLRLLPSKNIDWASINGLGTAQQARLTAVLELCLRLNSRALTTIKSPEDVLPYLAPFAAEKKEHLLLLSLSGSGQVIATDLISIGTLNSTMVHPREVFIKAINHNAAAIVMAHNHPSGSIVPSTEDQKVTQIIQDAGKLLGIPLLDHIIFTEKNGYKSLTSGY